MEQRIVLGRGRAAGALSAWFRANRDEVLARLGLDGGALEAKRRVDRAYHSMDHGRDRPPNSPFVDTDRVEEASAGLRWTVDLDIARWNPQETARASVTVRASSGSVRLDVSGHAWQTDRIEALDVAIEGVDDPDAVVRWLADALRDA